MLEVVCAETVAHRSAGIGFAEDSAEGIGRANGSFGEIAQGRLSSGIDFLVTLPIVIANQARLTCRRISGPTVVECHLLKARAVGVALAGNLGLSQYHITIELAPKLPTGKGLSSSTADMLATVRAFEGAFGVRFSAKFISALFAAIEPHDALHYATSVLYNHRAGQLLADFNYIPAFVIVALDTGKHLDTCQFNKKLTFSREDMLRYDRLCDQLMTAFAEHDDRAIAVSAYHSTQIHAERYNDAFLFDVMRVADNLDAWGVVNTHSGTCPGLLYPADIAADKLAEVVRAARERFHIDVFVTRTIHQVA